MNYFKNNRNSIFSWINDFSDGQDELRNSDVNDLSWGRWFWFHPSAYSLIMVGAPVIGFVQFVVLGLLSWFLWGNIYLGVACGILALFVGSVGYGKIVEYRICNTTSFYDVFVRDYTGDKNYDT